MQSAKQTFGIMDIPLSCSIFLEPALQRYAKNIVPLSRETKQFVHEWNIALVEILNSGRYDAFLGGVGQKILRGSGKSARFVSKCVESARSVPLHSLHYAIRFSESLRYLSNKIGTNKDVKFVDLGCGFSPMTPVMQTEYNLDNVYCIGIPEIIDVYTQVAERVSGRAPHSISWSDAKQMAISQRLDTIIAMGVLPYIDLDTQVSYLKFINYNFPNFLVEIKYNNNAATAGENVFDLQRLQRLSISVEHTETLETTLIRNSLRYLRKFMYAMPGKRYFLANDRSLFLSR